MLNENSISGKAVVIGAGIMGSGIAAMLANAKWDVWLLDRLPDGANSNPKSRNSIAQAGLDNIKKAKPQQFGSLTNAARVRVGNIEDHLQNVSDADWVVEAVAEDLETKKSLMGRISHLVSPKTVISSNTSGLSLNQMVADCPESFQKRFLGTHFFNPPRIMRPVEIIPADKTDPRILDGYSRFAETILGKKVVRAKDTPGFISTRLGMYALSRTIQIAVERGLTVEAVDYLTGKLIGRPRSGTFRLADVVGIDITARITENLKRALPDDLHYQHLKTPKIMLDLIASGRIGAKSGSGFYQKNDKGIIQSLDLQTGDYRDRIEPPIFDKSVSAMPLKERIIAVWDQSPQIDNGFLRAVLTDTLGYMLTVTEEVSDRVVAVDDAIMGGFGWEMGPYLLADVLKGSLFQDNPPGPCVELTGANLNQFYDNTLGTHSYFDLKLKTMRVLERATNVLILKDIKKSGKAVIENPNSSLIDIGEEVACFEWRTKMNTITPAIIDDLRVALDHACGNFRGLVLGGGSPNFSAGFDLRYFAEMIKDKQWAEIDARVKALQDLLQAVKFAPIPVVSATSGYTLGGGCEITLHCTRVRSCYDVSMALPEAKVGLIPVGGGCTQMFVRAMDRTKPGTDSFVKLHSAWATMFEGKITNSADEALELGLLLESDSICMNSDHLLYEARKTVVDLSKEFVPRSPMRYNVLGSSGLARFEYELHNMHRSGKLSEFDTVVGKALARVLCGGDISVNTSVNEQYLLNLEREQFLSLCGELKTLNRIQYMLDTGKPLKN